MQEYARFLLQAGVKQDHRKTETRTANSLGSSGCMHMGVHHLMRRSSGLADRANATSSVSNVNVPVQVMECLQSKHCAATIHTVDNSRTPMSSWTCLATPHTSSYIYCSSSRLHILAATHADCTNMPCRPRVAAWWQKPWQQYSNNCPAKAEAELCQGGASGQPRVCLQVVPDTQDCPPSAEMS